MFESLKNLFRSPDPVAAGASAAETSAFSAERLKMLTDCFPIGKKVRYYPEYQREIDFQTIVLAYRVNDQFVYSRDAVETDAEGRPIAFRTAERSVVTVSRLAKLQFLLPDTSDMERTLDYFTRAEIGSGGQFRLGNTITLVGDTVGRAIPTVDSSVDRRLTLRTGPFADSPTVLVSPELETLVMADQRQKQRVVTEIPAYLHLTADGAPFHCMLNDFSDVSLRLVALDAGRPMPELESERRVVVEFSAGEAQSAYRLRGKVFRRTEEFCVIDIEHLYRNGDFGKIKAMDILEIKSDLLNRHPA